MGRDAIGPISKVIVFSVICPSDLLPKTYVHAYGWALLSALVRETSLWNASRDPELLKVPSINDY